MSSVDGEEADFLKAGDVVVLDGDPWEVLATEHHGEGTPGVFYSEWVVLELRSLVSGVQQSLRLSLGSPVRLAKLDDVTLQFLHATRDGLHFMDASTFEELAFPAEHVAHVTSSHRLREGDLVDGQAFEGRPLAQTLRRRPLSSP